MKKADHSVSRILVISTIGALIFSVVGIFLGIVSNSDMVLLDGLYAVLSLLISSLSLFTSIAIKKPNHESFPFGKYVFQPLTIIFNSSIMLLLCILSLVSSVYAILQGGRDINANIGLFYGIFSFVGCGLVCLMLSRNRKRSDLIYAEMLQWLLDTVVSFGLVFGFVLMFVLKYTPLAWLIPYIDPGMVLLAGIILITMPIRLLYNNGKELISMSASEEVQYEIFTIVKELNLKYNIREEDLRISKMGQAIYIDLQNIVDSKSAIRTIEQADVYRDELIHNINEAFTNYDKWLNISFTEQYYLRQLN
ncbi:cation transporter [Staphylococcus lugdunensis]|jgi:cation diffusion facilitator family transporter|uniref:Cation diffusion facilitator family transporter n=2 Tax=Staphylococcus TaxID=1279 RepID=A0A133Q4Y4_STALU|nr:MULTISPECIES: cation transporter [Staphylococcus]ADC86396.1 Cobalt-zinc-cadmium resistance protein [Staphylococcus lugdunensis HKU09-01]AMG61866.1 cobalt-zinc-cadmium resistance protein [Staphylococcus lugdunensis]AMG64206.1 cobalt-zinc-cadmium resistance protein [Staphylococcus lugdunensis]ARJ08145.1 cobalt-zinc-cadmium resistance protein [Staphylococcus lugdunensis]ARJ10380.1 cobalt-zinc-cadmium resistance protein [Staphylococcus lugdunensis]